MSSSRAEGCRYTQDATSPSLALGSATTKTGTPQARADSRPAGSVSTATAPADTASWQNSEPWWWPPGSAAYRSPGRTRRESWVTPRTSTGPRGPVNGSAPWLSSWAMTTPSSAARPDSGRPCALRGRGSAGTRRGYRCSPCGERHVWALGAIRRNLQRRERELHHLVKGRSGHVVSEIVAQLGILDVDRHHELGVAGWRDADVTRPVLAQAVGLGIPDLGGAGLGRDRVPGNLAPRLVGEGGVEVRNLLQDADELGRGRGLDHPLLVRARSRVVPPARSGGARHDARRYPDPVVGDGRVDPRHLHGGGGHALAERQGEPLVAPPLGRRREVSLGGAGQRQAGRHPDAEGPVILVLQLRADVLGDLHHADVARMRQNAGQGEPLGGMRVGVVEWEPVDHDLLGHRVAGQRCLAVLQRRRRGDHLCGAARREDVRDRLVDRG